jgi:hypothetical protein
LILSCNFLIKSGGSHDMLRDFIVYRAMEPILVEDFEPFIINSSHIFNQILEGPFITWKLQLKSVPNPEKRFEKLAQLFAEYNKSIIISFGDPELEQKVREIFLYLFFMNLIDPNKNEVCEFVDFSETGVAAIESDAVGELSGADNQENGTGVAQIPSVAPDVDNDRNQPYVEEFIKFIKLRIKQPNSLQRLCKRTITSMVQKDDIDKLTGLPANVRDQLKTGYPTTI